MRKILFVLIMTNVFIFWPEFVIAQNQEILQGLPPGVKGGYETVESEILKVFAIDEDGARYRSYLIKWKGHEVIAADPLGMTDKKKGDKVTFMAQHTELPGPDGTLKLLSFTIMEFPGKAVKKRKIKKQEEN